MSPLFRNLVHSNPDLPLARVDEMSLPQLAEGWNLYEAPTWVFLGPEGTVEFTLERDMDDASLLSEIRGWLAPLRRGPSEKAQESSGVPESPTPAQDPQLE